MKRFWQRAAAVILIFLLCLYISTFWCQVMLIQGDSMEPAYHDWQFVLLDKHTEAFGIGDVVAFRCKGLDGLLVKRIAAVPGDALQIVDGKLYVNGQASQEEWWSHTISYAGRAAEPITLAEEECFVLGDNLVYSKDSRYEEVGSIKKEAIIGKVIRRKK